MTASSTSLVRPAAVAMAVDTVGVLPIFLTGALAVQLRNDIGLSVDLLGLVYASYFTAAALFSAPLSHVSDRTGPEWALRIGTVVYIVSFLGLATLATSPVILSAFIALAGLGTALTRTASSVLIARNVNPEASRPGLRPQALIDPYRDATCGPVGAGDRTDCGVALGIRRGRSAQFCRAVRDPQTVRAGGPEIEDRVARTCRFAC